MAFKKIIITFIVLLMISSGILAGCNNGGIDTTTTPVASNWYQETVKQLKAIQPTEIPVNLTTDGLKTGGEFDVNEYFSVLTHLSMEEGYVLDYVYLYAVTAGGPILYIRKASAEPFKTYEEYREATHRTPRPYNDLSMIWLVKDEPDMKAGNKIKIDGTPEGYFQYALLQTIGNQFYLYGSAVINDKRPVCEAAELEKIFTEIKAAGLAKMDDDFKKEARALDLQPVVAISDMGVTVQFMVFSKWGGFMRVSVLMYKDYPHTMLSYVNDEVMLAYQSGAAN